MHWKKGWAEMHRANYFARYASRNEEKEKSENALKLGIFNMEDTIPIIVSDNKVLPLPAKYFYVTPKGKPSTTISAYAGYALELLCKKEPSIEQLLVKARSSVEGLRKLIQAIEKISPGLYKILQTGDYTEENFSEKLATVIQSNVVGGIENAIITQTPGPLKDKWDYFLERKNAHLIFC